MISPTSITDFNRTDRELQIFWLFCIMVAGKNSDQVARKLGEMMSKIDENDTPFAFFSRSPNLIHNMLVANRIGQYGRIESAIKQSLNLDLRVANLDSLMSVFGVGPKTARFFLLHTRKHCKCAVLDTHILKWLKQQGYESIPDSTPQNTKEYIYLENLFLDAIAHSLPCLSVAEADLFIWTKMSGRLESDTKEPTI